ncbi:MAG TPA: hypothetical protein VGU20_06720 [Stellaceae bacterium]|nr:hypothetical protein [Stellaceae bacterium]
MRRKLWMGWDVGGWHCDRNKLSRDALVLLEPVDGELRAIGKWRGNLRGALVTLSGVPLVREMLALCQLREAGSFDLTVAIDTPLGWPRAMLRLASGGERTPVPEDDRLNPYTRRDTELDLIRRGYQPLSAVRDMLGSQSTKGIHFLRAASLPTTSCGVWRAESDGVSVTAIETYPAVARKSAPLASRCGEMLQTAPFSSPSGGVIPDVEDALVCALLAHLFSDPGGVEPVPPTAPEIEGWIILPRGIP